MKIEIDTALKTIEVKEVIIVEDFITELKKLIPEKEWDKYKIKTPCYDESYISYIPYIPYTTYTSIGTCIKGSGEYIVNK